MRQRQPGFAWLPPTMTRTTITLSRRAFNTNVSKINDLTGYQALALVVKSNAYGHGIFEIASLAESHSEVSWICTAGMQEALFLREKGIKKPLLVLSYLDGSLEQAVRLGIHLVAASLGDAQAIAAAAQSVQMTAYVHVKVDTGMGRLGILADQAVQTIYEMTKLPFLKIYGVFTHLSHTGHADQDYSYRQLARFDEVLDDLGAAGIAISCTHALSSSSLHLKPKRTYSFMRVGASAYGLWKTTKQIQLLEEVDPSFKLTLVFEWKTSIIQVKQLPAGSNVGYQLTFTTQRPSTIAIVPIGYWDGYPHALSNKGVALLRGYQVPVVGIISMNLAAFDVTDVPGVRQGDELVLIGNAPMVRPYEVAQAAGQITNVLMTCVNSSINRNIVEEHQSLVRERLEVTPSRLGV